VELKSAEEYKQAECVLAQLQELAPGLRVRTGSAQSNKSEDETSFLAFLREASAERAPPAVLAQRMEQLLQAGNRPRDLADAFQTAALEPSANPHAIVAVLPALLRFKSGASSEASCLCIRRIVAILALPRQPSDDSSELALASAAFGSLCFHRLVLPSNALLTLEHMLSKPHQLTAACSSFARLSEFCAASLLNPEETCAELLSRLRSTLFSATASFPSLHSYVRRVCASLGWNFSSELSQPSEPQHYQQHSQWNALNPTLGANLEAGGHWTANASTSVPPQAVPAPA